MTFLEAAKNPISKPRAIVQLNIGSPNIQWVNAGAGIWKVNFDALYPEVESELLPANIFFVQNFPQVGSVQCDGVTMDEVSSLAALTGDTEAFYYSLADKEVYICIKNFDEPILHEFVFGVVFGYSSTTFVPIGSSILYEGRLVGSPTISIEKDPLFFGKLKYSIGSFQLINSDGFFDQLGETMDIYGNICKIFFGYEDIPISEYKQVLTGVLENVTISESIAEFNIMDQRRALSKSIAYSCTNKNALDVIEELLLDNYGIPYSSDYFIISDWEECKLLVPNITINIGPGQAQEDIEINELIELICNSVLGLFITEGDGRYSFRIVDTNKDITADIKNIDLLNKENSVTYDSTEVISSTKVGYSKIWSSGTDNPYTFLYDTTQEANAYKKYKIYNQKEFLTLLTSSADAQQLSDTILLYFIDVHGKGSISVPMSFFGIRISDMISIEINRLNTQMIGTKKCEVLGIKYNLIKGTMDIAYRLIYGFGTYKRITPEGYYRITPEGYCRITRKI